MFSRLVGGSLMVLAASASAQQAGDATAGHDLAMRLCSSCHIVGAERVGSDVAPTFQAIANDPDTTFTELHAWLGPMHPVLKDLALTTAQIADINAYLDSLRAPEGAASAPAKEPPPPIENAPPEKLGAPIRPK